MDDVLKEIDPLLLYEIEQVFRKADKPPVIAAIHAALFIGFTVDTHLGIASQKEKTEVITALFNVANLKPQKES